MTPRCVNYWRNGQRRPRPVNGFRIWMLAAMVRRTEDRVLDLLCDVEGRP